MSLADTCDVVYTLLLERLDAQTLADRQVVATLLAAGAADLEIPDVDDARARFDEALVAEPPQVDRDRMELTQALGVA